MQKCKFQNMLIISLTRSPCMRAALSNGKNFKVRNALFANTQDENHKK